MVRFWLLFVFFLISLLAVFKAPIYYFWLLAVAVTNYPLVFAGITAVLLGWGYWVRKYQFAGTITGIAALVFYLSPIARAYTIAGKLDAEISAIIGIKGDDEKSPFSFFKFLKGRPATQGYKTINYVTYADTALSLDYYASAQAGNRPCVIVVHGGSWSSGDSQQLPELNTVLAQDGYNVATINYRMAPKYQNPAPIQDVKATLDYLRKHAAKLRIDTNNFVLLGRSAGAQIALLAAYTLHNKGIKGCIDFYGPADMVWGYSVPSNPLIMDSRGVMNSYLGGTYDEVPENYAASSPIEFVDAQSVPTLIIHGGNDVLVAYEHSRRLSEKLHQNGVKNYWLKLPWATHGFDFNINGPGGQLSTYAVKRFLINITTN